MNCENVKSGFFEIHPIRVRKVKKGTNNGTINVERLGASKALNVILRTRSMINRKWTQDRLGNTYYKGIPNKKGTEYNTICRRKARAGILIWGAVVELPTTF